MSALDQWDAEFISSPYLEMLRKCGETADWPEMMSRRDDVARPGRGEEQGFLNRDSEVLRNPVILYKTEFMWKRA